MSTEIHPILQELKNLVQKFKQEKESSNIKQKYQEGLDLEKKYKEYKEKLESEVKEFIKSKLDEADLKEAARSGKLSYPIFDLGEIYSHSGKKEDLNEYATCLFDELDRIGLSPSIEACKIVKEPHHYYIFINW